MTITEAKQLCIVDYLASIGYHAQYVKVGQYWYRSPLRQEKTPSFKVNSRLNEWYDFGAATGGDLVELGKHLYQTNSVSEVLTHIEQHIKGTVIPHVRLPSPVTQPMEPEISNMIVVPLKNHALLSYLRTRLINTDVAKMFCKEIHYELRGRKYFALGFKNQSEGFEIRNPYYKGCIKTKDISIIRHQNGEIQRHVCIFEGFMDFLSYLTLKQSDNKDVCIDFPSDYLVMNSVNNLKKTLGAIDDYQQIHCYLDNDMAGKKTVETISGIYAEHTSDESSRYFEYKDLNDYLRNRKM